jgi:flagella basal body P-ring formation protein FlgA
MHAATALLIACLGLAALPLQAAEASVPLTRSRLVDAAAAALFGSHDGQLEARPLDEGDAALAPPPGALTLKARIAPGTALARRMLVHVDVHVGPQHWRTIPVWFAVRAWQPVWVARTALAAGQPVGDEHFRVERAEVAGLTSPALPTRQPPEPLRLRRALEPGTVLTALHVERQPAVARHQPVQVQVQAGAVSLQASGLAMADARIGEQVRVLNPTSRESFTARVVAAGLVVVEEISP